MAICPLNQFPASIHSQFIGSGAEPKLNALGIYRHLCNDP